MVAFGQAKTDPTDTNLPRQFNLRQTSRFAHLPDIQFLPLGGNTFVLPLNYPASLGFLSKALRFRGRELPTESYSNWFCFIHLHSHRKNNFSCKVQMSVGAHKRWGIGNYQTLPRSRRKSGRSSSSAVAIYFRYVTLQSWTRCARLSTSSTDLLSGVAFQPYDCSSAVHP